MVTTALLCVGLAWAQQQPRLPEFSPTDPAAEALEADLLDSLIAAYSQRADYIFVAEVISARVAKGT